MTRQSSIAVRLALLTVLSVSGPAQADDQDVIEYRQHIMKTMGEQMAIIGMMLQQKIPAADLATHAQVLAISAKTAKMAFETKVQGGDAKPDVWTKWPDFAKRLDALVVATDDLAKTAKNGGATATGPKVQALACKGCHDTYRVARK